MPNICGDFIYHIYFYALQMWCGIVEEPCVGKYNAADRIKQTVCTLVRDEALCKEMSAKISHKRLMVSSYWCWAAQYGGESTRNSALSTVNRISYCETPIPVFCKGKHSEFLNKRTILDILR
ncbi:hypothetical protein LOAG_18867 [Loa loa]|uniref:Uncharacterized protein n=1 Tax=Loa loa TaxID=7209 RepID=A0A1S0UFS9_LOALO|nr:hypothetical protein LOAG_18867 [Loa loa]EJD73727.1 hypothetical protein LOAG_18867 [Loa loa]